MSRIMLVFEKPGSDSNLNQIGGTFCGSDHVSADAELHSEDICGPSRKDTDRDLGADYSVCDFIDRAVTASSEDHIRTLLNAFTCDPGRSSFTGSRHSGDAVPLGRQRVDATLKKLIFSAVQLPGSRVIDEISVL